MDNFKKSVCEKCGKSITYKGEQSLCGPCKSHYNSYPDCEYYENLELSVDVPYCNFHNKRVLLIEEKESFYCNKCPKNLKNNSTPEEL